MPGPWDDYAKPAAAVGDKSAPWESYGASDPKEGDPSKGASLPLAALQSVGQGVTFGFGPEILAGVKTGAGLWGDYGKELEGIEQGYRDTQAAHPIATTIGEIAGAIASPVSKIGAAAKGVGLGARVAGGARQGAVGSALWAAGNAEGSPIERAGAALEAVPTGTVLGAALGTIGRKAKTPPPAGVVVPATGREVAEAGQRVGVDIPVGVATDNMGAQAVSKTAQSVPFVGDPLRRASERAIQQTDEAAGRIAQDFGGGARETPASAGVAAREGVERYIGPTTTRRATALYDRVDNLVDPQIRTPLANVAQEVNAISAARLNAGLPESGAVRQVLTAVNNPNGLNYPGIKLLRTRIGEQLEHGPLPPDVSKQELRKIYSALSEDLRTSAGHAGGQAGLDAFEKANKYYRLVSERRENLARLLKTDSQEGIFEKIMKAASSSSSADIMLLTQARKAMSPDEWNAVASAASARLGRDAGGNFSPDRFMTQYGKLSPAGKVALFRSAGRSDLANALDDVSKVSERFKQLNKFANPSGTARHAITASVGASALANLPGTVAGLLGANMVSHILARPATARAMANWGRAYAAAAATSNVATLKAARVASQKFAAEIGRTFNIPEKIGEMSNALASEISPKQQGDDNKP